MKKKNITMVTLKEALKTKGKTRKDAPPGPPLPDDFWKHAKVVYPEGPKEATTIRFDADILAWFKAQGPRPKAQGPRPKAEAIKPV